MNTMPVNPPQCYVLDSSSLINIERRDNGRGLRKMPEYPGSWLVVPHLVAKQVNNDSAPAETKHWFNNGKVTKFIKGTENELFMKLRVKNPLLEDPDIQGIVLAFSRNGTYVAEDRPAISIASSLGIRCIKTSKFFLEIQPILI